MWERRVDRTSHSSAGDDCLLVWLGDPDDRTQNFVQTAPEQQLAVSWRQA